MAGTAQHRGFGHLRRLPSKRWQASYVGPDLVRHKAAQTFQTKGDAEAWLAGEQALVAAGTWTPPALRGRGPRRLPTFSSYAEAWLAERPLKPRTQEGYEHLLRAYLVPAFGALALGDVTAVSVRKWWIRLDHSTPTVNARAYALLKTVLNSAIADGEITQNPCHLRSAANPPRARQVRPASLGELDAIVAALPRNDRALVLLCAWCALRIGEALELRRKDIDLERAVVRVRRAVSVVHGQHIVGTPKTAAGVRDVAIPPHVIPGLVDHLEGFVPAGPDSLLFPARDGQSHMQPSVFHARWRVAREAGGRPDLRVHDLRHTGATWAAMTGATLAELQARLGHSTAAAALRYQHAAQGRDAAIAEGLSRIARGEPL